MSLTVSSEMFEMDSESKGDSDAYRRAVKMVVRKQLKELLQQLEDSGEEVIVMAVDLENNSCSHFGTSNGNSFMADQKEMMWRFLEFCRTKCTKEIHIPALRITSSDSDSIKPKEIKPQGQKVTIKSATIKSTTNLPGCLSDVLKFEIPEKYTEGITDTEVAGLVGRIVASKLVISRHKGETVGSKFQTLIEVANKAVRKDKKETDVGASPVKPPSTPGSTRSGRKVSSKFLESINTLKKHSKIKGEISETDLTQEVTIQEEKDLIDEISTTDPALFKGVHVKTEEGKLVNVGQTVLTKSTSLETLAILIIHELDLLPTTHQIFCHKYIKVMLLSKDIKEENGVKCEIIKCDWVSGKVQETQPADSEEHQHELKDEVNLEEMDEGEASELRKDLGEFYTEMDYSSSVAKETTKSVKSGLKINKVAKVATVGSAAGLIRKPKGRHYTESMQVDCQHCGITLTGRSNLQSHIKRVHMQIKNHNCTICRKAFWSSNALESHMLSVHTRQCEACHEYVVESVPWSKGVNMKTRRDVICTCGSIVSIFSTFGRKRLYLRDDEPDEEGNIYQKRPKNNTGTKYACGTCGKLFMKKSNCERHSRRHTDVKSCVCDICGTAYAYESSLKKHLCTEHGIVRHVCDICGGNYASLTALKVHIVKVHRNIAIGDDSNIVLNQKAKTEVEEEDAEEIESQMETDDTGVEDEPEIIVNGTSGEIIVHHKGQEILNKIQPTIAETSATQSIVVSGTTVVQSEQGEQIVLAQADSLTASEEHIVLNQGSHIVVTSDGTDQTAQLVQQVIDGQVAGHDGNMSIIIKQVPIENEIY